MGLAAALITPYAPLVGVPLAAYALGRLASSGHAPLAVVTALAGAGAVAIVDPATAVFTVPALLLAGPGVVWGVKRWPAVRVMVVLAFVLFGASLASDAIAMAADGTSIMAEAARSAAEAVRIMSDAFSTMRDPAAARALQAQLASLSQTVALMWPSSYFETAALTSVFAVILAARAATMAGLEVNRPPRLAELDLSVHFVWPVAAGLLLLAASPFVDGESRIALAIGANMLVGVRLAFLAQGMGVATAVMKRVGFGLPARAVGYVFLLLADLLTYSVSVVGLADMWMNFRRLPRESGRSGGPEVSEQAS